MATRTTIPRAGWPAPVRTLQVLAIIELVRISRAVEA